MFRVLAIGLTTPLGTQLLRIFVVNFISHSSELEFFFVNVYCASFISIGKLVFFHLKK